MSDISIICGNQMTLISLIRHIFAGTIRWFSDHTSGTPTHCYLMDKLDESLAICWCSESGRRGCKPLQSIKKHRLVFSSWRHTNILCVYFSCSNTISCNWSNIILMKTSYFLKKKRVLSTFPANKTHLEYRDTVTIRSFRFNLSIIEDKNTMNWSLRKVLTPLSS